MSFLLILNFQVFFFWRIYEFTRILGILLDNAIEAADECDERNIYVHIRNDQRHNRQLLIIENTYKDKNISSLKEDDYSIHIHQSIGFMQKSPIVSIMYNKKVIEKSKKLQ